MDRLTLHSRGVALLAEKGMAPPPSASALAAPSGPRRLASHLWGPSPSRRAGRRALQRHASQGRGAEQPAAGPPRRARCLTASRPGPSSSRCAPPRAARKRKRGRAAADVPGGHGRRGRAGSGTPRRALACRRKQVELRGLAKRAAAGGGTAGGGLPGIHRLLQERFHRPC